MTKKLSFLEEIAQKEEQRKQALSSQDAENYARICDDLGLRPEDEELYNLGHMTSDSVIDNKKTNKTKKSSKSKINLEVYKSLVEYTVSNGINVENVFSDISLKKKGLKNILGYEVLNSVDGKVPLNNSKDSRIGKAYLDHYNRARRKIGK